MFSKNILSLIFAFIWRKLLKLQILLQRHLNAETTKTTNVTATSSTCASLTASIKWTLSLGRNNASTSWRYKSMISSPVAFCTHYTQDNIIHCLTEVLCITTERQTADSKIFPHEQRRSFILLTYAGPPQISTTALHTHRVSD